MPEGLPISVLFSILEFVLFCVLPHPMDAETHNILPGEQKRKGFSLGIRWPGGRDLHTTRGIAQMFLKVGCV